VKFSAREIRIGSFPLITQFKALGNAKMIKIQVFREAMFFCFFNRKNTKIKRFSKINFSVSELHRWAIEGKPLSDA